MTKTRRLTGLVLGLAMGLTCAVALSGCREKGPLEKAGEDLDNAIEDAADAIEDAGK